MKAFVLTPTYERYRTFLASRGLSEKLYVFLAHSDTIRGYDYSEMEITLVDTEEVDAERLESAREAIKLGAKAIYCGTRKNSDKQVVFMVAGTSRILAVLRPDGNNWWDPNPTIEEKSALLQWIGKIRDYVDERNSLNEVVIQVEVEYDPKRVRFRHVAGSIDP